MSLLKMILNKKIANTGVILAFLSVVLGAFGAHGLKDLASPEAIQSFTTGVRYEMYHALALLFLSLLSIDQKGILRAYYFFVIGIVLFSGSIYALTAASIFDKSLGMFALLTPIGGLCLLIGWAILFITLLKNSQSKSK
ncbi:MAG: DUF423 domain-containing protein [Gilvibacter sp.]